MRRFTSPLFSSRPRSFVLALAIALPSAALGANGNVIGSFLGDLVQSQQNAVVDSTPPRLTSAARATGEREEWPQEVQQIRAALDSERSPARRAELVARLGIVGGVQDVERVLDLSENPNFLVSAAAIEALGRLGTARAVHRLTTLAHAQDSSHLAIRAMGLSTASEALVALEDLAQSPNPIYRQHAFGAMAVHGGPRVRRVLHTAFDRTGLNDAWTVANALAALGGAPERRLLAFVATQRSDPRASAALHGLAALPGQQSATVLLDLARNATGDQRITALQLIGGLPDPEAVDVLLDAWHQVPRAREAVLQSLSTSPAPGALDALLEIITDLPHVYSSSYVQALVVRPEPMARAVLRGLAAESGLLAEAALGALAQQNDSAVLDLLGQRFDAEGRLPPAETLSHLASQGGDLGWELIEEVLATGNEDDRGAVIWALQVRGDKNAIDRLIDLARTDSSWVGASAITALETMPGGAQDSLRDLLLARLEDDSGADISATLASLGRLGGEGVHEALGKRLELGTVSEKWASISALGTLTSPEARGTLEGLLEDNDPMVRGAALNALVYQNDRPLSIEFLNKALSDEDGSVRSQALSALQIQGTPEALERLFDLSHSGDRSTRIEALGALSRTGGVRAEEALLTALDDPEVGVGALRNLQNMGSSKGQQAILDLAQDDDSSMQVQALGMLSTDSSRQATEILRANLSLDSPEQAAAAAQALSARGDSQSAEAIAEFFDSIDPDDSEYRHLRVQTAGLLKSLGGPLARERQEELEECSPNPFHFMGDMDGLLLEELQPEGVRFQGLGLSGSGTSH